MHTEDESPSIAVDIGIMGKSQSRILDGIESSNSDHANISDAVCYAKAVRNAISFGNDTDTSACIAGGFAGIKWVIEDEQALEVCQGEPRRWLNAQCAERVTIGCRYTG